jgi:hypothetical protein
VGGGPQESRRQVPLQDLVKSTQAAMADLRYVPGPSTSLATVSALFSQPQFQTASVMLKKQAVLMLVILLDCTRLQSSAVLLASCL